MAYGRCRNGLPKVDAVIKGGTVCNLIKSVYFKDKDWSSCCMDIAFKFSELKEWVRKHHATSNEESVLEILRHYAEDDLREALDG